MLDTDKLFLNPKLHKIHLIALQLNFIQFSCSCVNCLKIYTKKKKKKLQKCKTLSQFRRLLCDLRFTKIKSGIFSAA